MISHPRFFMVLLVLSCAINAKAQELQRYNSFSYNVNEGLLQSNIIDLAFDQNNFCWLSYANGIQKFDGKNFVSIPVQPGLPDDKWTKFFNSKNGNLLISHSHGISRYDVKANKFIPVYKHRLPTRIASIFIGEDENIIYFYTDAGYIIGIDADNFRVLTETATGLTQQGPLPMYVSSNIVGHHICLLQNNTLYLWDLQKRQVLFQPVNIPSINIFFIYLTTEEKVMFYSLEKKGHFAVFDFANHRQESIPFNLPPETKAFRWLIYPWQGKSLLVFYNNLYETDSGFSKIKAELVNFKNGHISDNAVIQKMKEDHFGNLYVVTINGGFRKIIRNNYPIKYYGKEGNDENYMVSILPDKKNNRILTGTYGNGLLIFDTLQHLTKHIKNLPGTDGGFITTGIIKTNNNDYLLFIWGEKDCWLLSNDLLQMRKIPIKYPALRNIKAVSYFSTVLFQNEREAFFQSERALYKVNFADNSITASEITNGLTMSGLFFNGRIITHANDELIFLDAETLQEIKRVPFRNTGYVRCFTKDKLNNIFVGSNKGIFKIDSSGKILAQIDKQHGLPDECIYSMVVDDEGFLWCSSNKGIFKINKDNSVFQLKKEDGLQENEFNTNVAAKTEDGEVFFAGVNGANSFYPSAIAGKTEKVNVLLTGIKINNKELASDTAVWNIQEIDLSYEQNSLSFDFVAMASNNPGQYIYQYQMDAVDDEWIQNNDMQTVRYHLPPGKYVFKMYASRFFDKDAKANREIIINIHPPFWRTWWFRVAGMLLLIFLLTAGINQYNRRKYDRKLAELESEHKLRLERERISRDLHDSIGAYANAVLYNTELLEKEKEEKLREEFMKDLKFASKDIITSLRETVWALKKDNYSAEDCMLRIRNFIQPFSKYYHHIKFDVAGEVPAGRLLHYTKALNLVRIVQEAITNSIKHAGAVNVSVLSKMNNDKWEVTITDDGKGFDYKAKQSGMQGNGLHNMRQRAADAGFDFDIHSAKASGTSVIIGI